MPRSRRGGDGIGADREVYDIDRGAGNDTVTADAGIDKVGNNL